MELADAPTPAAAGEHAVPVEVADDVLDAHRAGRAVAFRSKAEDQPRGVSVQRVDLPPGQCIEPTELALKR